MVLRDGNVGIGTKSPNSKLQVDGGIYALTYSLNGGNMTGRTGGVYNYRNVAESSIYQSINWTPSPTNGNAFDNTSQGACGIICSAFTGNASIRFYVRNTPVAGTAPNEVMTINGNGNVGIDTNQPAYKLDVNGIARLGYGLDANKPGVTVYGDIFVSGTASSYQHITNNGTNGGTQGTYLTWNRDGGTGKTSLINARGYGDGGFEFSCFNVNGAFLHHPLLLNGDGSATLHGPVHSQRDISCAGNANLCGNGTSSTFICGTPDGNTITTFYTEIMYVGRWTEAKYGGASAYNPRATEIRAGDQVFNGGATSYVSGADLSLGGQNLHWVNGFAESSRIVVEGGRAVDGSRRDTNIFFYTNGSLRCTMNSSGLTTPSDERLKTNIETLTNVLSSIKQIRGVKYNLKSDPENSQIGVIAQEIEAVFPELIQTSDSGEKLKSMNYQNLTGVLLQAIKEQQVLIESQQSTINAILEKISITASA
jgi:hypothetical protein